MTISELWCERYEERERKTKACLRISVSGLKELFFSIKVQRKAALYFFG